MFYEGQEIRLYTQTPFRNAAGVATDPTTVTLTVQQADGTETAYTYAGGGVTKTATGTYEKLLTPPVGSAGIWGWEWRGTGAVAAVDQGLFRVRPAI
jgi:hypothetical protein